jgi:hypothetical protein
MRLYPEAAPIGIGVRILGRPARAGRVAARVPVEIAIGIAAGSAAAAVGAENSGIAVRVAQAAPPAPGRNS